MHSVNTFNVVLGRLEDGWHQRLVQESAAVTLAVLFLHQTLYKVTWSVWEAAQQVGLSALRDFLDPLLDLGERNLSQVLVALRFKAFDELHQEQAEVSKFGQPVFQEGGLRACP